MILAFSPEQAQEVAQAFEIAATVDAPWWLNNELLFRPNQRQQEGTSNANKTGSSNTTTSSNEKPAHQEKSSFCNDVADSMKASPKPSTEKVAGRPINKNFCPGINRKAATFQSCRRSNQGTRCQRQAGINPRIIEERNPIHMHQETCNAAKMSLDVTGFAPEDISITIEEYIVSIKGTRRNKLGDVFVVDRRFRLDKTTANVDQVSAAFDDGILEISVPKKSVVGPRKIPILVCGSTGVVVASNPETQEAFENEKEDSLNLAVFEEKGTTVVNSVEEDEIEEETPNSSGSVEEEEEEEEEEKEQQQQQEEGEDAIAVETVYEDEVKTDEQKGKESNDNDIVANKSVEEEETWEEVSE